MTITPGARFGPYTVTSILGTGGMGQVYLARDARLDRNVALKVLPPDVAGDADRLQRFKREAMVLASLSHHNIAAIYGLEEGRASESDAPVEAIVLELVEGPTLGERIAAGPVPLDEARSIGMQIAAALEAAHERGIVHRDLKPANVKIRPDGTVKVLDFGLAKAREGASSGPVDVATSPTFTRPAQTHAGIILGTAAYMSPEQARGAPVDKRTDVWAFGCVLFEMLAGRHVFGGVGTVSDAIAAVLKSEPDWQALPADTPATIRSLLRRCLVKDPRHRLRDIGDAGLLLADSPDASDADRQVRATPPAESRSMKWAAIGGWALAALLAIVLGIGIAGRFRPAAPPAPAVPLRVALPLASELMPAPLTRSFAVSSDGRRVVFVGRDSKGSSLYLQDLVSGDLKRLPETRHAAAPAFSPDDRAVGFITGPAIKVLNLEGGLPRNIAQAETDREQWAWSGPGHVVFTSGSGLSRVSVNGGAPEAIATLAAGETRFMNPFALPGGAYLVSVLTGGNTDDASRVAVVVPGESTRLIVAERGGSPAFAAGSEPGVGHIVFAEADRLMAIPFDAIRRVVKGNAVPIVENVAMRPNGDRAEYTVSNTGTLIFREGSLHELVWIDRGTGTVRPLSANLRRFALPRLSPDGSRLAMEMQDSPHQIWMLDIERDALVPLTTESAGSHNFAWAPDGQSLAYTRGDRTATQLGLIRADGSGTVEKIDIAAKGWVLVEDWSRDGRLALMLGAPTPAIMTVRLDRASPPKAPGAPVRVADGSPGSFSPDGSWLAYCDCAFSGDRPSNVFIQHLESGARHQVSTDGGWQPLWADSGRELFFRSATKMMAVPVTLDGASARLGRPQVLFEGDYLDWGQPNYDVTADGKQFVMVRSVSANARSLSVRLNWLTELERLSPTQR